MISNLKTKKISIPKEVFEQIFMQNGGQAHKAMTGEYILPHANEEEVNAEIEKGEFVQDSGGVKQALGDTHENGGTKVVLEDGAKVLSDHLKITAKIAKQLNDKYDLGVKASDTYSKVLDRYNKKSGLDEINAELEKYIKKLEEQNKNTKDENTLALNTQYLTEEINEEFKEKEPLEKQREVLFNELFEIQESAKKEKGESNEFQLGGQMTFNGDTVIGLANKYNIDMDKAKELIAKFKNGSYQNGGSFVPKYQDGKNPKIDKFGRATELDQDLQNAITISQMTGVAPKYTDEQKKAIKEYYSKFVKDRKSLEELNKAIDDNKIVFNKGLLTDITTGKTLDISLQHAQNTGTYGQQVGNSVEEYVYKDAFRRLTGRDYVAGNEEDDNIMYNEVQSGLLDRGIDWQGAPFRGQKESAYGNIRASEPGFVESDEANIDFSLDVEKYKSSTPEQKKVMAEALGKTTDELDNRVKNITTKYIDFKSKKQVAPNQTTAPAQTTTPPPVLGTPPINADKKARLGFLPLPDQSPLPPSAQAQYTPLQARGTYIDPVYVSPEQQLAEFERSRVSAEANLNMLPSAQAAAVASQLNANTNASASKAIGEVNRYNAQAQESANRFNAQLDTTLNREQNQYDLQYKNLTEAARDKTEQDWRNYYNRLNQNNVNNWMYVETANRSNALNPDVQFTGFGYEVNRPDFSEDYRVKQLMQGANTPTENLSTKKKPVAKKGGRFKK